ncbi:MAG: dTDP-4-dehydrorhamnose 3,5-epimerase [Sutterellaceae bacterium]|nr:dTDP-4-dehydrorhamnose 3,5-epimerase [Burkholderiaceae bacterium]MDW8429354.1 dTDP-4-dehydrorhamnose 3,5-epimerase [Sutterellaceae bacterium]
MIFTPTRLAGAFVIELERKTDQRGFFARTWCRHEFARHGIDIEVVQASVSHTPQAGTLRGMHFAWPPSREGKLVRCERGGIFDVIIDLRPESATFAQHISVELNDRNQLALYIPPGFAHGFQTLVDDTNVVYMMTDVYRPELADGVRYDDTAFGIRWPLPVARIAERDATYPDFDPAAHRQRFAAARQRAASD